MPRAVIAVTSSLAALTDAHATRAEVIATLQAEAPLRFSSALVVVSGAVYRHNGIAVVPNTDLAAALRDVQALPDPVRVVVVPSSAYRAKPVAEAQRGAGRAGWSLTVLAVMDGASGLVEATNEYGEAPTCRVLVSPGAPVDEEPAIATSPEPVP